MRIALMFCASALLGANAVPASLQAVAELPSDCYSMQFISSLVGWCRADSLFRTADGGKTWGVVKTPTFPERQPEQFQFLNPREGWVRTLSHLYWTQDAGSTWREVSLPLNRNAPRGLVLDVHFSTPNIGWVFGEREVPGDPQKEFIRYRIAGDNSVYVPALFRTEDGGRTWKRMPYPDLKGIPYQLQFADNKHGLSIELNETLYTQDGGQSWNRSKYCAPVDKNALTFAEIGSGIFIYTAAQLLDAEYGWWTVQGDLFRTTDGGQTWCQLPSIRYAGEIVRIEQLRFASRERGWAVPASRESLPVFQTIDGGMSWTAVSAPSDMRIRGCALAPDTTAYFWASWYSKARLYRLRD